MDNPDIEISSPETHAAVSRELKRRERVTLEGFSSIEELSSKLSARVDLGAISGMAEPLRGASKLLALAGMAEPLRDTIAAAVCVFWYCALGHMEMLKVKEGSDEAGHLTSNQKQPLQVLAEGCHA